MKIHIHSPQNTIHERFQKKDMSLAQKKGNILDATPLHVLDSLDFSPELTNRKTKIHHLVFQEAKRHESPEQILDSLHTRAEYKEFLPYVSFFEDGKINVRSRKAIEEALNTATIPLTTIRTLLTPYLEKTLSKIESIGMTLKDFQESVDAFEKHDAKKLVDIMIKVKEKYTYPNDVFYHYDQEIVDSATNITGKIQDIIPYTCTDPLSGEKVELTRSQLRERITMSHFHNKEKSSKPTLVLMGGLPGTGKSSAQGRKNDFDPKEASKSTVYIDQDHIMSKFPEYRDEKRITPSRVVKESTTVINEVKKTALDGKYNVIHDEVLSDRPEGGFPKYKRLLNSAKKNGYTTDLYFLYDTGANAWMRNVLFRERSIPLHLYLPHASCCETLDWIKKTYPATTITISKNSTDNGLVSVFQYKDGKEMIENSALYEEFQTFSHFMKNLYEEQQSRNSLK